MSSTLYLKNSSLTVSISTMGAELQSVRSSDGVDYLWCGDPSVWSGRAPIMFPICGALKDNAFIHNEKEYSLTKHGFAKLCEFDVIESDDTHAVFRLTSSDELRQRYPFDFIFDVSYTLSGNSLLVEYRTENTGVDTMYFSVGAHEAYSTPEGIEQYTVTFEKEEKLYATDLDGVLLSKKSTKILDEGRVLALKQEHFAIDALIFRDIKSKSVTLSHKDGKRSIKVDFDGFDNLLLWTKPNAKFLCIEPWCGIPDFSDADGILSHKAGITSLMAKKQFSRRHTITFS